MPALNLDQVPSPSRKGRVRDEKYPVTRRFDRSILVPLEEIEPQPTSRGVLSSGTKPDPHFRFDQTFYRVGGVRKLVRRTADVVGADGVQYTTSSPRPGMTIVNGLSDKIDEPRRVSRSRRRNNSSRRTKQKVR